MSPKFRGDSDDWLDKDTQRKSGTPKKKPKAKALGLDPSEANATVAEVFPNQCKVKMDHDGRRVLCHYRRSALFGHSELRERAPVAVGDRVKVNQTGADGVVEGVCLRKNRLARPAPARDEVIHVVVANVDLLVIVVSAKNPDFSPGLIDRFLVSSAVEGIESLICVNKVDIINTGTHEAPPWRLYQDIRKNVMEVSARQATGIEELRARLLGKTVAFCGHSGVGKTSLLRTLLADYVGKIAEVSTATGKGQHTTTGAILLEGPSASQWIDTPGIREFGLHGIPAAELSKYFEEFNQAGCNPEDCTHIDETGCRAKELPRYSSYRRIYESLLAGEH